MTTSRDDPWRKWRESRKMGRTQWILRYGVCGVGLWMAIFWPIVFSIGFSFPANRPIWEVFLLAAPVSLIAFPAAGYIWGAITWSWFEARYHADAERTEMAARIEHLEEQVKHLQTRPGSNDTNIMES